MSEIYNTGSQNSKYADAQMLLDLISQVLRNADNPVEAGLEITEALRELTGARTAILLQCLYESGVEEHKVVAVSPSRRQAIAESTQVTELAAISHDIDEPACWMSTDTEEKYHSPIQELNLGDVIAAPLSIGKKRLGCLLLIDVPAESFKDRRLSYILEALNMLTAAFSLVFRNALLYREQEELISERTNKLVESNRRLIASQMRYRELFEQIGDYILILRLNQDNKPLIAEANKKAWEKHGYTREEFIGKPVMELDCYLDEEHAQRIVKGIMSGENFIFETKHRKKDGSIFPVEVSIRSLFIEGEPTQIISVERDITERKQSEAKLKEQQFLLEKAQELGKIGTWYIDLKNNTLRWTEENSRIFGLEPGSDVNYELFISKVHPEDRDYVNYEWERAMNGHPYNIEHRLLIDGVTSWVSTKAEITFDNKGKAITAVGFTQDITENKQIQNALLRSEADLSRAQRIAHLGSWTWDVKADIVSWSDEMYQILGFDPKHHIPSANLFRQAIHPDDSEIELHASKTALEKPGNAYAVEHRIVRPDGTVRFVVSRGEVNRWGKDNEPLYMVGTTQDVTEHRVAEQDYRTLFSSMIDGFAVHEIITDDDNNPINYRFITVNPAFERLTGLKRGNICGRTLLEVLPGTEQTWIEKYGEIALHGGSIHFEEYSEALGKYFEVTAYQTAPRKFATTFVDITKRKLAEAELREHQFLLEKAQELGKIGTWHLDIKNNILKWTDENCRIFGVPPGSIVDYETFISKVHPSDREYVSIEWGAAVQGKEYDIEHRILVDGKTKWVNEKADVVFGKDGTAVTAIGFTQDITERKLAEFELELLNMAVEQAAETVVITDAEGTIRYANPAFERVTGYKRVDAIGQNPRILKSGQHDEAFYEDMWRTLRQGETWQGRIVNKDSSGALYTEDVTISPIKDASNNIVNYVAVKRDITHEVEMEKSLYQAQKMQAIGTLAGGIAHDFNNILYAILGFTELAMDMAEKDSPLLPLLAEVDAGAKRGSDLVDQILAISRRTPQDRQLIKIEPPVKEALKLLRGALPSYIRVEASIDETGTVVLDPTEIHQIIMNLCTNAHHAMHGREGKLVVLLDKVNCDESLGRQLNLIPGDYARLIVGDNGVGMDESTRARIFEPYFTTKKKGEGTGLGLATVNAIVTDAGGHISLESSVGKGTTFEILLPLCKEELIDDEQANETPSISGGTERLLIVDDEVSILAIQGEVLKRLGYSVRTFSSSLDAWHAFEASPSEFDLVLTDQTMPELEGVDLAKKILELQPNTPVIICTGYSATLKEENILALGISEILKKPVDSFTLAQSVRNALNQRC